jgi:glyoxylase-like metal-dependent hydrolase (beta-lactamase superfamily II)
LTVACSFGAQRPAAINKKAEQWPSTPVRHQRRNDTAEPNMAGQIPLRDLDQAPRRDAGDGTWSIAGDLAYVRLTMVNVVMWGSPGSSGWVLIDTGLRTSADEIVQCAEKRFGADAYPAAIILTHGHFDHAGSVEALAERWDVPVYAHPAERPYLSGTASYPPADPWVGGGVLALISPLFPRGPIDLGDRLTMLPEDRSITAMPGWQWIHTPGHAPGHVSLWRESDRTLIAGDAVITTGQESAYDVAVQKLEMHGPPRYFTPDWRTAEGSVRELAELEPELLVTGHGVPAKGPGMRTALRRLAREFEQVAVPKGGKYVRDPASAADGTIYRNP